MDDPEYQYVESNPNPKFRPSVDHLISQLRRHKAFRKPDAVVFVVNDIIDHFLVREQKRPDELWAVVEKTLTRYKMVMGHNPPAPDADEAYEEVVPPTMADIDAMVINGEEEVPVFFPVPGPFPGEEAKPTLSSPGEAPQGESEKANSESGSLLVLRKDEKERGEALGIINAETATALEKIIFNHYIDHAKMTCGCGRRYEFLEQWARHVRIRIWRYLQNEFKGDE